MSLPSRCAINFGLVALSAPWACGDSSVDPRGDAQSADVQVDARFVDVGSVDAGRTDGGSVGRPRLDVGLGQDAFLEVEPGTRLEFEVGAQSNGDGIRGYHIWGALRAYDIDPDPVRATFTLHLAETGQEVGDGGTRTLPLITDGAGGWVGFAYRVIVDDCCARRNADLLLRVAIEDPAGLEARGELSVVGDDACFGTDGADICLP